MWVSLTNEGYSMEYGLDTARIGGELDQVERRRWLFDNLPIDPVHAGWLRQRAWVRTIHGTTRIEGNTLNDLEVEALLEGATGRNLPRKDVLEIIGTRDALSFADEIAAQPGVAVDERVICEIHRRVLHGQSPLLTPGQYRRGENRVVGPDGEVVFTTPVSGDVPELMRSFAAGLGDDRALPVPAAAALAHLEFVAIHPFNDGNGRSARALSRLLLIRGGYALDGLVSLDAYLDQRRSVYFRVIRESIGRSYEPGYDATPFVIFFLGAIATAADHVLARIKGLGQVLITVRRDVVSGALPPAMIDGLAYAWLNRSIRPGDYQRITGRTAPTTTRDLAQAVALGYLIAEGDRRGRWYRLGPRLLETPATGETADPRVEAPSA